MSADHDKLRDDQANKYGAYIKYLIDEKAQLPDNQLAATISYSSWCKECQTCQRRRTTYNKTKSPTGHVLVQRAFQRIYVGLVEYKSRSISTAGVTCKYVLSIMDRLTRFVVNCDTK